MINNETYLFSCRGARKIGVNATSLVHNEISLNTKTTAKTKILHVDDDPCILEVSKSILELEGNFEVDSALSVDEALKKLEQQSYDAVLSDYEMPQKSGLDFLKEIRQQKNEIPFILFTGKGREEVAMTALNLGADGYFNKQGSPETVYGELAHGIRQSVERNKAEESLRDTREYLDNLLSDANGLIIVWDNDHKITLFNNGFAAFTGYKKESMLGKNLDVLFPASQKAEILQTIREASGGEKWQSVEVPIMCKHGETRIALWNSANIKDKNGNIVATIAQGQDITERKKAEENLEKEQHELDCIINSSPIIIAYKDKEGRMYLAHEIDPPIFGAFSVK